MPAIPFAIGAYRRQRGSLPEFKLVNMFLEKAPSSENGVVLMSRPPLDTQSTVGSGPIRAIFSREGTFSGDEFIVSGSGFYRNATLLGTIAGSSAVTIATSGSEVLVTAGDTLYSYNGTDFQAVALPDSFPCQAIAYLSGHFIGIRDGTQKFYWSAQLDGRSWDALDFASAESDPDNLLDAVEMRGNLYLLGESTIEPWYYTGALDLPFTLIQQRLFSKGVVATGFAMEVDNALIWVGDDLMVYRTADVPERISDHGIEERLANASLISSFAFIHEGHSHFALRLTTGTIAYDLATGQWWELQSFGRDNFLGRSAALQFGVNLFGDDTDGTIWKFADNYDDEPVLVREFTAAFPIKGGAAVVDNVTVDANVGQTELLAGQGSNPIIELATSRDAGITWGDFRPGSLGRQGAYRVRSRWNRLGTFDSPGAMFKFRVSDPVQLRVSNVYVNEPGGGVSR